MVPQWAKNLHWTFICSILMLCGIGTLFIHSATNFQAEHFATKQMVWFCIGFVVFILVAHLSYRFFMGVSYLFYALSILLLIAVHLFGYTHFGAQRWINIGPLVLQPSEFAKLATVMALANFLGSYERWENENRVIAIALGLAFLPALLIVTQPDLGTALLFFPMIVLMLFLWGIRYRYLIVTALIGIITAPIFWTFLKEYQRKRLLVFLNPNLDPLGAGYTAIQSKIAVGAGGMFGKGYLMGTQSQLDFVPEHHTDFIFCVIGEEWGFFGALLLLVLYGILFKSCFHVMERTTDLKAKLLTVGIVAIIFSQVFINIGMTIGLMPITGLTLPLISYGGSSFLTVSFALGLILSVYRERSIF